MAILHPAPGVKGRLAAMTRSLDHGGTMTDTEAMDQIDVAILDTAAGALATGVHCGDDDDE